MNTTVWGKPIALNKISTEIRQIRAAIRGNGTQSLSRLVKFATFTHEGEPNATTDRAEAISGAIRAYLLDARPETAQELMEALKMEIEYTGLYFDKLMREFVKKSPHGKFILTQFERNFAR